jgi:hypothetical protein
MAFTGYLFSGLWNKRTGRTPLTVTIRFRSAVDAAFPLFLCFRGETDTVLACWHTCLSGLLTDYGFGEAERFVNRAIKIGMRIICQTIS